MTLLSAMTETFHKPALEVYLGGARVQPLAVSVDHGYDAISATATITLARYPTTSGLRVPVTISAGWGGYVIPIFVGTVQETVRGYAPHTYDIHCAGRLRATQYQAAGDQELSDVTDGEAVAVLLELAGITQHSVEGSGRTFESLVLRDGSPTWELINHLDQLTGYRTFDCPDGIVRRRRVSGLPTASAAFALAEGINIFAADRPRAFNTLHNRVAVYGHPDSGAAAVRQADSIYVPDPPRFITFEFRSDLIADSGHADEVAQRLMLELNHVAQRLNGDAVGNPYLVPGMTISGEAPHLGLDSAYNYILEHFSHTFDNSGFTTRVRLAGGIGSPGEPGDPGGGGVPEDPPYEPAPGPEPAAEWRLTRLGVMPVEGETPNVPEYSGTTANRVRLYAFNGDALASYDPAGNVEDLTYSWSNNKNADTGADRFYATAFTKAQMEDEGDCIVTLTVTNTVTSASRSVTFPLSMTDAHIPKLFAVAAGEARASADGGEYWSTVPIPSLDEEEVVIDEDWEPGGPEQVLYEDNVLYGGTQLAITDPEGGTGPHNQFIHVGTSGHWTIELVEIVGGPSRQITVKVYNTPEEEANDPESSTVTNIGYLVNPGDTVHLNNRYATGIPDIPPGSNPYSYPTPFHSWVAMTATNFHAVTSFTVRLHGPAEGGTTTIITSVTEIAGESGGQGWAIFGSADGGVWAVTEAARDEDQPSDWDVGLISDLREATPAGDGSPVTTVWLNEADHGRAAVGTSLGRMYYGPTTTIPYDTAGEARGNGWQQIATPVVYTPGTDPPVPLGVSVSHVMESALNPGQYWLMKGGEWFVTHDGGSTWTQLADPEGYSEHYDWSQLFLPSGDIQGRQSVLSPFANYGAIASAHGSVFMTDGTEKLLPTMPDIEPLPQTSDPPLNPHEIIMAGTHHLRADQFWAITRYGEVLTGSSDATDMTLLSTIPNAVQFARHPDVNEGTLRGVWHSIRDGWGWGVLYVATTAGLYVSYDGGATWRKAFSTGSSTPHSAYPQYMEIAELPTNFYLFDTLMVGYGSPEWI